MSDFFSTQVGSTILGLILAIIGGFVGYLLQSRHNDKKSKRERIYQDKLECLKNLYANRAAISDLNNQSMKN